MISFKCFQIKHIQYELVQFALYKSKTTKTMTKTANSREKNSCEISLNKFKEKFQPEYECRSFAKITPCEI